MIEKVRYKIIASCLGMGFCAIYQGFESPSLVSWAGTVVRGIRANDGGIEGVYAYAIYHGSDAPCRRAIRSPVAMSGTRKGCPGQN